MIGNHRPPSGFPRASRHGFPDRADAGGTFPPLASGFPYPRVNTLALGGFCAYVLIWFLQVGVRVSLLGKLRIEFLVGASLLAAAALLPPSPVKPPVAAARSMFPYFIGALFLAMLVQLPFSQAPAVSSTIFWDRVVKFACMAVFITRFVKSPADTD